MDDGTDIITPGDDRVKIVNHSTNPYSNIVYLNDSKNPFDRQFEFAYKNKITYSTLPSSSTLNRSSPLNTPSIPPDAFNAVAPDLSSIDPSPAITTAQITNLILETEIIKETQPAPLPPPLELTQTQTNNTETSENNNSNGTSSVINAPTDNQRNETPTKTGIFPNNNCNDRNNNKIKHRSNVVSVICPPVPQFRDKIRSAPVILDSTNCNELPEQESTNKNIDVDLTSSGLNIRTTTITNDVPGPSDGTNNSRELCTVSSSSEPITSININYPSILESCSTYKKILPKQNPAIDSSSPGDIAQKLSSLPPTRRKEKTLDELIRQIKATEAALPPKAKPGRKSKTATEEDAKERKRLSLERNRAAAMRCRLKKKKEIDELKHKVEGYEQQNQELKKIINDLCHEVNSLKNKLLRHKDCN